MSKNQLISFMTSAFCFLCMVFNGFHMAKIDASMMSFFLQFLLMVIILVTLYSGLKGFVSESVETTKNQEAG